MPWFLPVPGDTPFQFPCSGCEKLLECVLVHRREDSLLPKYPGWACLLFDGSTMRSSSVGRPKLDCWSSNWSPLDWATRRGSKPEQILPPIGGYRQPVLPDGSYQRSFPHWGLRPYPDPARRCHPRRYFSCEHSSEHLCDCTHLGGFVHLFV